MSINSCRIVSANMEDEEQLQQSPPPPPSHNNGAADDEEDSYFIAQCHCGRVRGRFTCHGARTVTAVACNCSDCAMRQNTHLIIPASDFQVLTHSLQDATILYQWGTRTAIRRFCKVCGILPWYHPRSNPDGVAITIHCVDWKSSGSSKNGTAPKIEILNFNGQHWEETMEAKRTEMASMSKARQETHNEK